MRFLAIGLLITALGAHGAGQSGPTVISDRDAELQSQLGELAKQHHGKVAVFARQLNTGRTVALDSDAVVQTASVIKLAILFEAMEQVRSGKAHWDDQIKLAAGMQWLGRAFCCSWIRRSP